MKKLYLIRHALPDFPEGEKMCLGLTDLPLGSKGLEQARRLGEAFKNIPLDAVYTSYLTRAFQTAECLSAEPQIEIGLEEMSAGEWDGLYFSQIEELYEEELKLRLADASMPLPGGEDTYMGQERFYDCVKNIMDSCSGENIAIVAHSVVMQSFICRVLGAELEFGKKYSMDYCECSVFEYDGEFHLLQMNVPAENIK